METNLRVAYLSEFNRAFHRSPKLTCNMWSGDLLDPKRRLQYPFLSHLQSAVKLTNQKVQ